MKRLALLIVALAACVMFTACPDNKPTEREYVIIPDGTYEETCECGYSFAIYGYDTAPASNLMYLPYFPDTVEIVNGQFLYNPCGDTAKKWKKSLIYDADYYCETGRIPVYQTSDGYVHFDSVNIFSYPFDFNYQAPVYIYENGYRFENVIHLRHPFGEEDYIKYIHTLKPIF